MSDKRQSIYQLPDQDSYDELARRVALLLETDRQYQFRRGLDELLAEFERIAQALLHPLESLSHEILAIPNAPWYVKLWWRIQDLLKAKGSGDDTTI